jgi:outer membrane protein TolC
MNATFPRIIRIGAGLSLLVALLAFLVRSAEGQTPTEPKRLTLGEAARLAAAQTANVQSAQLRVQEAQSRVLQQKAALLPQVDAEPNWTSRTINSATFGFSIPPAPGQKPLLNPNGQILGPIKIWDFRGQASQSIYDPAAKQRVNAAKAGVGSATADVATVAENSASTAALTYVRTAQADATVQARIADSTLAAGLLGIARDQLSAGVGIALDVTRAESQLANARAQLIGARNDRNRAYLDLKRSLNMSLDAPVQLADSLASLPYAEPTTEEAAIEIALRTRPDLKALDAQLSVSQQQLAAVKATKLPRVSAFGNDGEIGFIDHLLNTYTYGVQLSWSAFDGGRRSAQAQEQEAMSRDIEVRRRDLRQQVSLDVRGALLDLVSAREQVDAARERQRFSEQEVAQAQERFRAGVASNADVITASATLNAARTGLIDALTAYQGARVSLARAEGTVSQIR